MRRTRLAQCGLILAGVATALLMASLVGCGGGSPATLSGTVKFSGQPVAEGTIRLVPLEGTPGDGGTAKITDGSYSIGDDTLKAGNHRVVIFGFRATGRMVPDEGAEPETAGEEPEEEGGGAAGAAGAQPKMIEEKEQFIPDKYNRTSQEAIELAPGENKKDFDLQP